VCGAPFPSVSRPNPWTLISAPYLTGQSIIKATLALSGHRCPAASTEHVRGRSGKPISWSNLRLVKAQSARNFLGIVQLRGQCGGEPSRRRGDVAEALS
jgi:hypothetical protein